MINERGVCDGITVKRSRVLALFYVVAIQSEAAAPRQIN
jgi:hypothetical protein